MPTAAGCWRSLRAPRAAQTPPRRLRPLPPLAEALGELGERRVLLPLDVQVTHAGVVQRLAVAAVDRQLAGAEDLERLLERGRPATITGADLAAAAGASLARFRGCAQRRACGGGFRRRFGRRRDDRHVRRGALVDQLEFLLVGARQYRRCERRRHLLVGGARLLLRTPRPAPHRGELRAHIVPTLFGGDRIAEESEPQPVPLAAIAAALDGVERVGTEDRERRHLVELGGLYRPLQLYREGHRCIAGHGLLERASRAGVVGLEQRDRAAIGALSRQRLAVGGAAHLEELEHLRVA